MRFVSGFGVGLFYLTLLPFAVLVAWATLDALVRPDSHWAAADQNKVSWVLAMLIGTAGLGPIGILVALVYLFGIRPRLTSAAREHRTSLTGMPPP